MNEIIVTRPIRKTRNYKHGLRNHPLYQIWIGMRRRCYDSKRKEYANYGGRGIKVCNRWNNPKNFIYDMFPSYAKGLTLERIDNNGPYSPENCKWATRTEQGNNQRTNRKITYKGKTLTLTQWSKIYNINYFTLWDRLFKHDWPVERALTEPINHNSHLPV